jgi:hypothetical protein
LAPLRRALCRKWPKFDEVSDEVPENPEFGTSLIATSSSSLKISRKAPQFGVVLRSLSPKPILWTGSNPIYQDQIVTGVTLAIDPYGPMLYNPALEPYSDGDLSPADTEWAFGTTAPGHQTAFLELEWLGWLHVRTLHWIGKLLLNGPPRTSIPCDGSVNLAAGRHCFEIQFFNSGGLSERDLRLHRYQLSVGCHREQ